MMFRTPSRPSVPLAGSLALLAALALLPAHAAEPDQVTLDLDQFLKLYEATKDRPKDPEKSPWEAAIDSARYTGEVIVQDGEPVAALFNAKLRIEVLKDEGWVRLPVLNGAVALKSARINGVEAPVQLQGGWYTLVTDRRGAFDLQLEFAAAVQTQAVVGDGSRVVDILLTWPGAPRSLAVEVDGHYHFLEDQKHQLE